MSLSEHLFLNHFFIITKHHVPCQRHFSSEQADIWCRWASEVVLGFLYSVHCSGSLVTISWAPAVRAGNLLEIHIFFTSDFFQHLELVDPYKLTSSKTVHPLLQLWVYSYGSFSFPQVSKDVFDHPYSLFDFWSCTEFQEGRDCIFLIHCCNGNTCRVCGM